MATTEKKSVFDTLYAINANEHTEQKQQGSVKLTYLSWAWAWAEVKKLYPDASYTIYKDEQNRPYIEDPDFGLMCYTTVTIEGQTHEMWLPVMNGANKAMRRAPYEYTVYNSYTKTSEKKTVEAATMFDVNKTIMRCLVKNLAMFGLGLYIYAGEDLPEDEVNEQKQAAVSALDNAIAQVNAAKNREEMTKIWNEHKDLQTNAKFKDAVIKAGAKFPKPKEAEPKKQQTQQQPQEQTK